MMIKLKTDSCTVNYPESLQKLAVATTTLLDSKIATYRKLFDAKDNEQVIVNYFDNLEEFQEFIYYIRGERESLPDYAEGTYDDGMVNAYVEPLSTNGKIIYVEPRTIPHLLYEVHTEKRLYKKDSMVRRGHGSAYVWRER